MNEQRTLSILQRLPVILAVTAASYGLSAQAQGNRSGTCASAFSGEAAQAAPGRIVLGSDPR